MAHARAEADQRMDAAQRRARADVERLIAEIKRLRDGRDESFRALTSEEREAVVHQPVIR